MVAWRKGRVMAEAETAVSQPQPREAQGCWEQQEPGVGRQGSHPGPSGSTARHPLSLHCYFQNLLSPQRPKLPTLPFSQALQTPGLGCWSLTLWTLGVQSTGSHLSSCDQLIPPGTTC